MDARGGGSSWGSGFGGAGAGTQCFYAGPGNPAVAREQSQGAADGFHEPSGTVTTASDANRHGQLRVAERPERCDQETPPHPGRPSEGAPGSGGNQDRE